MTAQTAQRAPRKRNNKPTEAALREQAATAKEEATRAAQAAKVEEAAKAAEEAAEAVSTAVEASLSEVQHRLVTDYRDAESTHGSSKHKANVAAVAYWRTLPESVTVKTAKSSKVKNVSARERAAQTLEALCVRVERKDGKVVKGLDTIGFTPVRLVQLVNAFTRAEVTGVVKVDALVNGTDNSDPEQVEALVSALDQAAVVGGIKAADALASSIREHVEEESGLPVEVLADVPDGEEPPTYVPTDLAIAVETAQADVADMRAAKAEQTRETPVVKTAAQIIGDALNALVSALEENAQDLDAGQKSALLAKVEAATLFLK